MNKEFEAFCDELRGLTNGEALTEIFKKRQTISRRQQMNFKPNLQAMELDELLRDLYERVNDLSRIEMFNKNDINT